MTHINAHQPHRTILEHAGALILVPGTAAVDAQFADRIPTIAGVQPNQVILDAILLALVTIGYRWQRAELSHRPGTAMPARTKQSP